MGLFTELRRSITRLWGRTEQAVGEAYGNEALEYEGEYDETKVDAEEATEGHRHAHRQDSDDGHGGRRGKSHGGPSEDDGTAAAPVG